MGGCNALQGQASALVDALRARYSQSLAVSSIEKRECPGDALCRTGALQRKYRAEGGADDNGVAAGVQPMAWGSDGVVSEAEEAQWC